MGKMIDILIVDDKVMITDLFESYIKLSGTEANVITYNDSNKALEFLSTSEVDVVITDYKMPGVNGLELLEASPQNATRILISGYVSDIAEEKLTKLHAHFFEKPVPMKQIGKIIHDKSLSTV